MPVLERQPPPVNRKGYSKYGFHSMQIGQSMFEKFTGQTANLLTLQQTILGSARYHGYKICSQIDEKKGGVRYWLRPS